MDYETFLKEMNEDNKHGLRLVEDGFTTLGTPQKNMVDHPLHYTKGKTEVIDIIEDAIQDAPSVVTGMLQAQVLKYLLRLWLKENSLQDAQKAQWYLTRLIDKLDTAE